MKKVRVWVTRSGKKTLKMKEMKGFILAQMIQNTTASRTSGTQGIIRKQHQRTLASRKRTRLYFRCLMNDSRLLRIEFHPEIRLKCPLLLTICVKSGKRTHNVTDSLKTMSCKSERTHSRWNKSTSSKRSSDTVSMITSRQAHNTPASYSIDPQTINLYFQSINIYDQHSSPEVLSIPDSTRIPTTEVHAASKFLHTLKTPGRMNFRFGSGGIMLINSRQQSPKHF